MRRSRGVGLLAGAAAMAVVAVGLTVVAPQAGAATNDQGLSGTRSSMWQTNHTVRALAVSNGVLYAGGTFTSVRPPGAAEGTNETPRTYLAAFSASTGNLITSFDVTLNGVVNDLAVSPDNSRLYVVGAFTTVNGTTRNRVAALSLPSGNLLTGFTANATSTATAVAATGSTVYVSGDFGTIGGVAKQKMASLNASTGAVNTGFTANLDVRASTLLVSPDGNRLLIGGAFTTVNGGPPSGIASVDPATGALEPWAANSVQPINSTCAGSVSDIVARGSTAYVTGVGDPPGCYEGTYAANISDGSLLWNSSCLGAAQGLAIVDDVLYKASHQHDCGFMLGGAPGGFVGGTSRDGFIWQRLVGQSLSDGTFVHWSPNTNGADVDHVGPHVVATDGSQLFVGGDFTSVDGSGQQGLARYGRGNNSAPNVPSAPVVQPTGARTLTVSWPAVFDRDSGTITYRLYRGNGSTPIYTRTVESYPWSRPILRYDDTALGAGSSYSYRVDATDGTFTSARSAATTGVAPSTAPPDYASVVGTSNPSLYWRLDDSGTTLADSSSAGDQPGDAVGGVTAGQAGALGSDDAVRLNGTSGYLTSSSQLSLSTSFTESAWFRTTSEKGGSILAISDQRTGSGGSTDRTITMDNNGDVVLSLKGPTGPRGVRLVSVREQGPIYNDGRWHQVVGTYDGTTLSLYVDGVLSGSTTGVAAGMAAGYQRAGYADLSGVQPLFGINFDHLKWPASEYFDGSIDEVATYSTALSAVQVAAQYAAGVADTPTADTSPPSVPAGVSVGSATSSSLTVSWSASSDASGVAGYRVFRGATLVGSPTGTSFTDTGLDPATTYSYTVSAVDTASNESAASAPAVPGTTLAASDSTPPSVPAGVSVGGATSSSLTVSWSASSDASGVAGYRVFRGATLVGSPTGTSFTDTGLAASTTYQYTVSAVDTVGNESAASSPAVPGTTLASGSPGSLFSDTWSLTDGAPWGSDWTTGSSSSGSVTAVGGAGVLGFSDVSGAFARAQLTGVAPVADAGALFSFRWNSTAARSYVDLGLRGSGSWQNSWRLNNGYFLELNSTSGTVSVRKNVAGTVSNLASLSGGQSVGLAKQWVRFEVVGDQVRVRTWLDGQAEPGTWASTVTDSSLAGAGQFFVSLNRSGSNTGAKTFAMDDFSLYTPSV